MLRKTVLILSAAALMSGNSYAQTQRHCYTDEVRARQVKEHPELLQMEQDIEKQVQENLKKIDINKLAKTTSGDTFWYDIPCVIHIIHDYGVEDLTDAQILASVDDWNLIYSGSNPDTANVIPPFKKYIGNPHIRIHLATKDPYGNPTHGITRHRSYLTNYGGNNAKLDDWAPSSYLNVWSVNSFNAANYGAEAFAITLAAAAAEPYYDGAITRSEALGFSGYTTYNGKVLNHEMSHCFNLKHTFGDANDAGPTFPCGDDGVDDTPPTKGNKNSCPLYDTACATGYFKVYTSVINPQIDSLVDYPDTTNVQNLMNYSACPIMFTKGQVERMHICLNGTVAGRSNLWDASNLAVTGALAQWPDLTPTPDFSVDNAYVCINYPVTFINFSYNDTVTNVEWDFSNGGTSIVKPEQYPGEFFLYPNDAAGTTTFKNKGWVTVTQKATGNGTGIGVLVDSARLFIADSAPTSAIGYFQEFNPASDRNMWPMFNYYNNEFKWQYANVGYYDNYSIMYTGYDSRFSNFGRPVTGVPVGDSDDFFTPYFDLRGLANGPATPNLNFMYSGAVRAGNSADMNDTLAIWYNVGCDPNTWQRLTYMKNAEMANKGSLSIAYAPGWMGDWSLKSIPLTDPAIISSGKVAFRFTYRPGVNALGYTKSDGYSTGNNFYMDRINFSNYPAGINTLLPQGNQGIVVAPNPTNADAYIVIKDVDGAEANVQVTDVSGRVVFASQQRLTNTTTTVLIPKSAIAVRGMYFVTVSTPNQSKTDKLVVY